jgi:SAM-dependent methyltransferase
MNSQRKAVAVREAVKLVLNAGCGPFETDRLHPVFRGSGWRQIRLDIDERVAPDIVGSILDLNQVSSASCDAIFCSHNLEHLHTHEVPSAIFEFRRVLNPRGFALITCPDLEEVAHLIIEGGIEKTAYQSPAGPITALDMIYGHSASIQLGNPFMAHNTGFTVERLGRVLIEGGFSEALVTKGAGYNLWALALMPQADKNSIVELMQKNSLDFSA